MTSIKSEKVQLRIMMKYEFVINFLRKYKKEIIWWIFFVVFCQTTDFDQFAYKPENYKPKDSANESKKIEE